MEILVAYATKYGATAKIAEKIGEVLLNAGFRSDIKPVNDVSDVTPYKVIILGSAVYYGRWRKDAVKFLKANEQILSERPVWLFSSGPVGKGDPVELLDGWQFPPLQQTIADHIQPRDIAVFHGDLNESKLNPFEKWVMKNLKSPVGDFRDWEAIATWATSIANVLKNEI